MVLHIYSPVVPKKKCHFSAANFSNQFPKHIQHNSGKSRSTLSDVSLLHDATLHHINIINQHTTNIAITLIETSMRYADFTDH
jgi:hypothetical protein